MAQIYYIYRDQKEITNALSRLPMVDQHTNVKQIHVRQLANIKKSFALTEDVTKVCPLDIAIIVEYQQMALRKNKHLKDYLKDPKSTYYKEVVDNVQIIMFKKIIYTPSTS